MEKNILLSTSASDHSATKTTSQKLSKTYVQLAIVMVLIVFGYSIWRFDGSSNCPTTKGYQDFYNFLLSRRQYENVTVISLDPLRVRVDARLTSPKGDVEYFSAEGE